MFKLLLLNLIQPFGSDYDNYIILNLQLNSMAARKYIDFRPLQISIA